MGLDVATLPTDVPNSEILDAVRNASTSDYQNRIPSADKAGVQATIAALMDPNNRRWRNEFIDGLVNRIGATIARSTSWSNPLAVFKRGMLEYGATIEEIQTGLLKAHNYDPDKDYGAATLFGRERPEVQVNFHTVNREDFYKVTINDAMLSRAFLDPTGLASFVNQLMEAPTTSDNWDEFLLTTSLFKEYEDNGGFYHVNVPNIADIASTQSDVKIAVRKMRAMADNLKFLSTKYNAAHMPVAAKTEDLVVLTTPEFNAAMDVEALAAAFNIERSAIYGRIVPIPAENFNITGCQAILTTSDFFVIADRLFETTSQMNAANMHTNYFLHHHEIISASRFVPAVMFTTGAGDDGPIVITAPTGVTNVEMLPGPDGTTPTSVAHGGVVALSAEVTPAGADQAVTWSVVGADGPDADTTVFERSSGTYITQSGVLHVGLDERNDALTVTATSVADDTKSATLTINISDAPLTQWPAS